MTHKYTFSDSIFNAGYIHDFVEAAQRYCSTGKKRIKQGIVTFGLFQEPTIRSFVPWKDVEKALGWSQTDEGLLTRRTSLVNKLKAISFEMCSAIDPLIKRVYNPQYISLRVERNQGLILCRLTHYERQPIEEIVKRRLRNRIKGLTLKGSNILSVEEIGELYYAQKFLNDDLDFPFKMMGPYRIEKEKGRGSTGRVFRARHEYSGTNVAVKVLNAELAQSQAHRERFFRGAQAMRMLTNPYILKILDVGDVHNDRPYYVSELIESELVSRVVEFI